MNCEFRYSIIIPLYNKADWVVRSLDSLQAQTYAPFEIIVVDDCSSDDSVKIVGNYARQHPQLPIRLFFGDKNQGPGGCRNRGIQASRGTHVLFLDADDTFYPELLSNLNDAFSQEQAFSSHEPAIAPQCVIFGYDKQPHGATWLFQDNPAWLTPLKQDVFVLRPLMQCLETRRFLIRTSNVAVSANALKGLSFDTSRATFEGISFWFRVLQRCAQNNWPVLYLRKSLHSVFFLQDSEIQKPLTFSQAKLPEVFRRYALSRNRVESAFCKRICTTWFWHELSRLQGGANKVLFFIRFAYVLPFLSARYKKPKSTVQQHLMKSTATASHSEN